MLFVVPRTDSRFHHAFLEFWLLRYSDFSLIVIIGNFIKLVIRSDSIDLKLFDESFSDCDRQWQKTRNLASPNYNVSPPAQFCGSNFFFFLSNSIMHTFPFNKAQRNIQTSLFLLCWKRRGQTVTQKNTDFLFFFFFCWLLGIYHTPAFEL